MAALSHDGAYAAAVLHRYGYRPVPGNCSVFVRRWNAHKRRQALNDRAADPVCVVSVGSPNAPDVHGLPAHPSRNGAAEIGNAEHRKVYFFLAAALAAITTGKLASKATLRSFRRIVRLVK